jgi:hypothetical protein
VIPPNWETDHAQVASKAATAKCVITIPGTRPSINTDLSYPTSTSNTLYEGGCRIQAWTGDSTPVLGDQTLERSTYLVQLDYEAAGILIGALVKVTETSDPDLVGASFTVEKPLMGSLRFNRDLFCVLDKGA